MFNFNDRNTYLAFRRTWKISYAELTREIRETRAQIKQAYRDGDSDRASSLQAQKAYLRKDARDALAYLAEAKKEAQRQYLAAKAANEAA